MNQEDYDCCTCLGRLVLPSFEEIPADFKTRPPIPENHPQRKWLKLQSDWFFCGIELTEAVTKPGVDAKTALESLDSIQKLMSIPHEHKCAAFSYLASQWFDDVKYKKLPPIQTEE